MSGPGWQTQGINLPSWTQAAQPGSRLPPAPVAPILDGERIVNAPTLGQYWRSDSRVIPGRRPARWAGRIAFWLGLLALGAYLFDFFFVGSPGFGVGIAQPIGTVAFLFGLIAVIAGVGRGLGILGLILAVTSNIWFWTWLDATLSGRAA